jgi:hypothetical protein
MKEFLWAWLFVGSLAFCTLLTVSLTIAYVLFATAPLNPHTPVFASGFGFAFAFFGLGALMVFAYDRLSIYMEHVSEIDNEFFRKVIREMPFFFFALVYFFLLAVYMGIFLLMLTYIRNAFA